MSQKGSNHRLKLGIKSSKELNSTSNIFKEINSKIKFKSKPKRASTTTVPKLDYNAVVVPKKSNFNNLFTPSTTFDFQSSFQIFKKFISTTKSTTFLTTDDAKQQINAMINQFKQNFFSADQKYQQSLMNLSQISKTLRKYHFLNVNEYRNSMKFEIAYHNLFHDFYDEEIQRLKFNVETSFNFFNVIVYLTAKDTSKVSQEIIQSYSNGPIYVDFAHFLCDAIKPPPNTQLFQKQSTQLRNLIKPTQPPPSNPNDNLTKYADTSTKLGKLMHQFRSEIKSMSLQAFEDYIKQYSELQKCSAKESINDLFDFGWLFRSYPFIARMKLAKIPLSFYKSCIPKALMITDIDYQSTTSEFPSSLDHLIDDNWAYMTFSDLYSHYWPFTSSVQILWDMLILTNPIDIVNRFNDFINSIGDAASIMINNTKQTAHKKIDLDFDQLFVLMEICIFASGLSEILRPLMYCFEFRELIRQLPEAPNSNTMFVLTNIEALIFDLKSKDLQDLANKSGFIMRARRNQLSTPNEEEELLPNGSESFGESESSSEEEDDIHSSSFGKRNMAFSYDKTKGSILAFENDKHPFIITNATDDNHSKKQIASSVPCRRFVQLD